MHRIYRKLQISYYWLSSVHGLSLALWPSSACRAFLTGNKVFVTPIRFFVVPILETGSLSVVPGISADKSELMLGAWNPRSWLNRHALPFRHAPRLNLKHGGRVDVRSSVILTCFSKMANSALSWSANRFPETNKVHPPYMYVPCAQQMHRRMNQA